MRFIQTIAGRSNASRHAPCAGRCVVIRTQTLLIATARCVWLALLELILLLVVGSDYVTAQQPSQAEFFERQIRPLLVQNCVGCHGANEQAGELRLDSKAAIMRGGENGGVIIPGDPSGSRLIDAVKRSGDLAMPPEEALSELQVAALSRWIELGAVWPDKTTLTADADTPHWAFQPIQNPTVPELEQAAWIRASIDSFVLEKLLENKLTPSPPADRRTLIRRATFDLLGLPPTPEEVDAFVNDDRPDAWERLIDRLLDSNHYGEKWARHWLDVARYSDTKGYVYAREERHWVHAWVYRDWVAKALNDDMPYNRFLLLQLAADQVDSRRSDLAAMGFLTIGRRFLGVTHDIIDDRIDVVTRSTMGLTVACARCHDHKYDPIPTEDYYALYGVFRNCVEQLVPLEDVADKESDFAKGLQERTKKFQSKLSEHRDAVAGRVRARLREYLAAQLELEKYPEQGFDQILVEADIMPEIVRHLRDYLSRAAKQGDTVFSAWRMFAPLPAKDFAHAADSIVQRIKTSSPQLVDPRVAELFTTVPQNMNEVVQRYGGLFADVDMAWQQSKRDDAAPDLSDPFLAVLYATDGPCAVPQEPLVSTEGFFPSSQLDELWKLRGEVDRFLIGQQNSPPHALALLDRKHLADVRVFQRGNPALPGETVERRFLTMFADQPPFEVGSGRLELANAIVDPTNPLTARVAVNRVWQHHFGAGIVDTPSDFGRRAQRPVHASLLDWLATQFVNDGWSIKRLHRLVMTSAAYRQSSFGSADPNVLASAIELDPENRLLWRMSPRRLSFEELRDATLVANGKLDAAIGGKAVDVFASNRRTLYAKIDRQFFPSVLRQFGVANPDLHIDKRSDTTVPQQALFFMNHPYLIQQAKSLAARCDATNDIERVKLMYRAALQREPTSEEIDDTSLFVSWAIEQQSASTEASKPTEWSYGFGEFDRETERLIGFQPLPFFDGTAWQGAAAWPDAKLGWVQLTADGGHAGNDKQHAAVRRWTAPRAMSIRIDSELVHDAAPGDGIRGFLVSSRQGLLKTSEVHMRRERFDVALLQVQAGEYIDFVVDLRDNLNHEEFLWETVIADVMTGTKFAPRLWRSRLDFGGSPADQMKPWELAAQVILSSNEFTFVD